MDLDAIDDFIATYSPANGRAFVERIEASVRDCLIFLERGTRREDLAPGLRTFGFERRVTIAFRQEDGGRDRSNSIRRAGRQESFSTCIGLLSCGRKP